MDLGTLHVAAATAALVLGGTVLLRRKGTSWHSILGRCFVVTMVAVNVPVLFRYEATGRPGVFHVLALVSLATTALGWRALRGPRRRTRSIGAHATFMTWSWIGVVSAGLAQLATQQASAASPWPVLAVVGVTTFAGLVLVPGFVARELPRARIPDSPPRPADDADGVRHARASRGCA